MGELLNNNNKVVAAIVILMAVNLTLIFASKVVVDKIADKVIQKIGKEYSPSPYGPGFDLDRVNVDGFKTSKKYFQLMNSEYNDALSHATIVDEKEQKNVILQVAREADDWRSGWENDRGFSI